MRRIRRPMWSSLVMAVAIVVVLAQPSPSAGQTPRLDKVALRLSFFATGQFAVYAYGLRKGIYAAEGIDLQVLEGSGSGPAAQSIAAGIDRFGDVDVLTAAAFVSKGMPVKVIASVVQTTPASIIALEEKGIRGPKDLEGKRVAFSAGGATHHAFAPLLKVNGVDRSKVHEVYFDSRGRVTAVALGQADAMGGFYNVDPARLEEMAKKKVSYFRYADHGVNFLSRGIIVHTKYLAERDVNCRFLRATARAWAAAAQNPDEAARILLEMFPKGPRFELSRAEWVDTATLAHSAHTRGKTLGWMAREDWDSLLDFQKTYGGATTTRPHAEYYSNDFIGC